MCNIRSKEAKQAHITS